MPVVSKIKFTESVSGCPVLVDSTQSSAGTIVHSAVTSTGNVAHDEIWAYASTTHSAAATVTLQYGSSASGNMVVLTLPASGSGMVPMIPGLLLNDSAILRAFASVANVVSIHGYANRITD